MQGKIKRTTREIRKFENKFGKFNIRIIRLPQRTEEEKKKTEERKL